MRGPDSYPNQDSKNFLTSEVSEYGGTKKDYSNKIYPSTDDDRKLVGNVHPMTDDDNSSREDTKS